jgi:hypothetical protein
LELIAKAVIAQRLEAGQDLGAVTRVPASHNVPQLWATARLPSLPPDDYGRSVHARVYLMWAGRYRAPLRDEDGERDIADLWEHANERVSDSTLFRRPYSFNYENIDRGVLKAVGEPVGHGVAEHEHVTFWHCVALLRRRGF